MSDNRKTTAGKPDSRFTLYRLWDLDKRAYIYGHDTINYHNAQKWCNWVSEECEIHAFPITLGVFQRVERSTEGGVSRERSLADENGSGFYDMTTRLEQIR